MLTVTAITTLDFLHCYKNAPEQVSYLRNMHRHLLHIEITLQVYEVDREIEFYMLKDYVDDKLCMHTFNENASCEEVAAYIMKCITDKYGENRFRQVKVQEDNNGYATYTEHPMFTKEAEIR